MEDFEIGKRAQRIHHKERLRKKRVKYWALNGVNKPSVIGMVCETPAWCSCWMCSKPRKHTLTIQETRDFQPKLQDLEIPSCNSSDEAV